MSFLSGYLLVVLHVVVYCSYFIGIMLLVDTVASLTVATSN